MGALLDEIKKYLGAEAEPLVYRIDAGAIKFFADSLMDTDPQYGGEDYRNSRLSLILMGSDATSAGQRASRPSLTL